MARPAPSRPKVVIIGFDGATWDLLGRLMERGTMPNLSRLYGVSSHGGLESCVPALTAPAWTSMVTGKNPAKHSVFDFFYLGDSISDVRVVDSSNVRALTLFEILQTNGLKAAVINLPLSWPPKTTFPLLGNFMTPAAELVLPKALLKSEIFTKYTAYPSRMGGATLAEFADEVRRVESARFEAAKALYAGEWDVFFLMFSGSDWIQHSAYRRLLEGEPSEEVDRAAGVFKDLDDYLGWFDRSLGEDGYLFLVSDHGFFSAEGVFSIDAFLTKEGMLTQKAIRRRTSITKSNEEAGSKAVRLPPRLVDFLIRRKRLWPYLQWSFQHLASRLVKFEGHIMPDPARTLAAGAGTTRGIVINRRSRFQDGVVGEQEAEALKRELLSKLGEYVKRGLFQAKAAEEVFSGPYISQAPDIELIPKRYALTNVGLKIEYNEPSNQHHPVGIYLVRGPGVEPGTRDATIFDILPTVLTLLGLPVPEDTDGHTLIGREERIAMGETATGGRSLNEKDEREITDRLKSLGYI
jgi:predicted AlkP superfamily phosphohydrolase/phosphomutase